MPTASTPARTSDTASAPDATNAWAIMGGPATPDASDPVVMELRRALLRTKLTLHASGRMERVTERTYMDAAYAAGQVAPASVEAFHEVLRAVSFCTLAPKSRESAPSYTVIESHFPNEVCTIELPTTRWEKTPSAKKVMVAVRSLVAEAFHGR